MPRAGRSLALLGMTVVCVPNAVRNLLDGVTAKRCEVLRFARDDNWYVVPNAVRDLLDWVIAKSREVPRFARDDSWYVVPNVVRDLLDGVIAKNRETPRFARDDIRRQHYSQQRT
ncbi:hypothetical protein [Legionella maceachernii]|uniref:hypothetical protein n=1 Tax=Legionella maceachernii TaxID=466 RepID=UPI001054A567|nr:hypothetical protein [Legionella maceachernii]